VTHYDYGFRIYNPAIAKFLSVDPLKKEYPELIPYQFASNTPIQAIDLDGLEAFFIHGTMSDNDRWVKKDGTLKEGTQQLFRLQNSEYKNTEFEWGGFLKFGNGPTNDVEDRARSARKLVKHVMKHRIDGEDITLIAHSHGGNVAIQAAPMLRKALDLVGAKDIKINIISVATPAVNNPNSAENPANAQDAIDSHIHIYNIQDRVQTGLAGTFDKEVYQREYKNPGTQNVKIDVSSVVPPGESAEAHSVDHDKPEIIKQNIDNGTIPKIKDNE
jgi:Alpha/beta hydrolase family